MKINMKEYSRIGKIIAALTALSLIGTAIIYPYLPDRIPTHWSASGAVETADKWVAFLIALFPILFYALKIFLSGVGRQKEAYGKNKALFEGITLNVALFLFALHWITILISLGYEIDMAFVVKLFLGIELALFGNYLGQIRQNYLFGIRNPWTITNEEVWKKVHHTGRYIYVIAGIAFVALAFVKGVLGGVLLFAVLAVTIAFNFLYSYMVYRKLKT
jgi:uncharacterized membrane protein